MRRDEFLILDKAVLKKIRAEIWNAISGGSDKYDEGYNDGIFHAIDVIDKYIKEESE